MAVSDDALPREPPPDIIAPALAPGAGRWARFRQTFVDNYLTVDARSLGLGRIVLATVLLVDLIRRIPDITLFYSNDGLVPNHMMLWRPPTQWMFSFFFMLSRPDEVAVAFVICGLIYFALLLGWRTRFMHVLALIAVLSLHGRVTLMENGGDWMLGELTFWSVFLPLGARFSVDAVRESLRRRREQTAAELADRAAFRADPRGPQVVSIAVLGLVLEVCNAYLFNAVHKGGPTWRHGTAVHYVVHQDRIATWLAVWIRPYMNLWLSRLFSWSALATEAVLPILMLSPWKRPWTRAASALAIVGLHTGFQCFINLGIFSWAMSSYAPFLLLAPNWEALARFANRRPRGITAYFDADCGVCFQMVRLWARLDTFDRIRFVGSREAPEDVSPDLLRHTVLVVDGGGQRWTRADAVAQILRAFPVGWLWSLPLRLPGLRALANAIYSALARRRERISVALSLASCAPDGSPAPLPAPERVDSPARRHFRRVGLGLRELAATALLITMVSETLFINAAVPKFLKHEQPLWIKRLVAYPRFIQAWSMFASDAPMTDLNMVVDATTVDGRHVDPYSEVVGRYPDPGRLQIPVRMDNDSFVFNYSGRIAENPAYHQALLEWVLHYPERTGRPNDQIVRFDCYIVEDDSPPVGQLQPRNIRSRIFLSYPPRR